MFMGKAMPMRSKSCWTGGLPKRKTSTALPAIQSTGIFFATGLPCPAFIYIDATAYTGNDVPAIEALANSLKDGGVATVAVNHDLMWNYDKAQAFNPSMIDPARYATDSSYASRIDTYMDMHDGVGTYRADHFVNVSNAVYDSNGALSHFIVSDTGNGTTKMIPKDYFQRAYNGLGNISVSAQGCVIAERRK